MSLVEQINLRSTFRFQNFTSPFIYNMKENRKFSCPLVKKFLRGITLNKFGFIMNVCIMVLALSDPNLINVQSMFVQPRNCTTRRQCQGMGSQYKSNIERSSFLGSWFLVQNVPAEPRSQDVISQISPPVLYAGFQKSSVKKGQRKGLKQENVWVLNIKKNPAYGRH